MGKFVCEEDYKANTRLTSKVSQVNFYLQKLKKTCAVCEEIINGAYYCGQDKRILCETHYKVLVSLQTFIFLQFSISIFTSEAAG